MSASRGKKLWKSGAVCIICGERIHLFQQFNYDHLIPVSRGGQRGRENKYLAHVICNSVKGNQWPFWLRSRAEREKTRTVVRHQTWLALCRAWAGHPD